MSDHTPYEIVLLHIDEYNRGRLEAFLAYYDDDIKIFDLNTQKKLGEGIHHMHTHYKTMFEESPNLKADVLQIFSVGDFVLCNKNISGKAGKEHLVGVAAIYEVKSGKIVNVWLCH